MVVQPQKLKVTAYRKGKEVTATLSEGVWTCEEDLKWENALNCISLDRMEYYPNLELALATRAAKLYAAKLTVNEGAEDEFKEQEHPREETGKFTEKGAGSRSSSLTEAPANKAEWPEHIQKLKLPPAWTDVKINPDPEADLLAIGKDSKGRSQYVYSEKFKNSQSAIKFARIQELDKKFNEIDQQVTSHLSAQDEILREHAACIKLIMKMGVRPGSDDDTKAKVKAYGATTLEGRHVVKQGTDVYLKFTGKKGVALQLKVDDPTLQKDLLNRAKQAGDTGKLFPQVSGDTLLDYTHSLDGGGFKTKDMRTLVSARTAVEEISKMPFPKSEQEYKKFVKVVAVAVSKKLGNTPVVALQSYIPPMIFQDWRLAVGL